MDKRAYQQWWEKKWSERERLLHSVFGETIPPNMVIAFYWDDIELTIPGGCAMVFPPKPGQREHWLTLTHGLSQPETPQAVHGKDEPSGYGAEFAFMTQDQVDWAPDALQLLLTYLKQSGRPIERGHRIPFFFFRDSSDNLAAEIGKVDQRDQPEGRSPVGEMRALFFWPHMSYPRGLGTSTGYFNILVGTAITVKEWQLAKATSSAHLLLMLFKAGIGQYTDLNRSSIAIESIWQKEWERISSLPEETAEHELLSFANS